MSLDVVKLRRRSVFAAAQQATTGTPASLSGTSGQFNVYDLKPAGEIPYISRPAQGTFGTVQGLPSAQGGGVTFYTYLTGTGSGSGNHAILLASCGFTVSSNVYTADPTANQTLTIGGYFDGRLFELSDCMGTVVFTIKAGEPVKAEWKFSGTWIAPSDTALISPTFPPTLPPVATSAPITIGGTQYRFDEMKIDVGNQVIMRQDVSAASGYRSAWITNRLPKVTVSPESLALATQNWFAAYLASTEYALSAAVGTTGNMFTFASSHMQQSKVPDIGDRNGLLVDGLGFDINKDSLSVTFA